MDYAAGARKLVTELVKGEQLTVRRAEIVSRDLGTWVSSLGGPPSPEALEDWLGDHAQVEDVLAPTKVIADLIGKYLTPPREIVISAEDVHHPELEAQLREHPDNGELFAVYADYLQEHGDPLGELIALGTRADRGGDDDIARFERYRHQHEARFFADSRIPMLEPVWRHGMIHTIRQTAHVHFSMWKKLLERRVASLVQRVEMSGALADDLEVVGMHAPPTLREAVIDDMDTHFPIALAARVRDLTINTGAVWIGDTPFPSTLQRLTWRVEQTDMQTPRELAVTALHIKLNQDSVQWLRKLTLPNLTKLELEIETLPLRDLANAIGEIAAPIEELGLSIGRIDPLTFATIAKLPIAKQIRRLALTGLELDDAQLQALLAADHDMFPNLVEIDVSFNELTRVGITAAKQLAPSVISTRQHKLGSGLEARVRRFAGSRLAAAEEIADAKHWRRSGIDGDLRWARYTGEADYELYISKDLTRFACTCPSSIQPCKHVVALALVDERSPLRKLPVEYGLVDRVGAPRELT
ncbi:MAG: TIGR02996 domain-containing protein [Kofleriaceae bacterium]